MMRATKRNRAAAARVFRSLMTAAALAALPVSYAAAQSSQGQSLVAALQQGGLVIVMRHASSPTELPGPRERVPGNVGGERQLDEEGIQALTGMRFAFRELGIPIGTVYSSPAFRARETAQHFGFGHLMVADELGGEDMASPPQANVAWLLDKAAEMPAAGTNTVIITHSPNLRAAFGAEGGELESGDALILKPDGDSAEVLGRIRILEWPGLALS